MKYIYIILIFTLLSFVNLYSQITYKIGSDIYYPDIKIQIGSDIYYPDIKIQIGSDVYYPDFSVGISSEKNEADFIITKSSYSDFKIQTSKDIYYPDLKIQAGKDVYYPDIKIKLIKTGTVNYVIYSEKDFVSMNDIISALLPVIHKFTDYEHESLNEMFNK
jgi:Uma2 family endonuclease